MAFFGKLIAPEQDKKKQKPIKISAFDNLAMLKQFKFTLVGRVLNMGAHAHRIKPLMGFLPSVWACEDRVTGVDMGRGNMHFNFRNEADLQCVLEKRPYHFDQWMLAFERWVPSICEDFPATIPFWIKIGGLSDLCCLEGPVKEIGEALRDLVDWEVQISGSRVRVMLECDLPLKFQQELEISNGERVTIKFTYEKLKNLCSRCARLTHDDHHFPLRPRAHRPQTQSHPKGGDRWYEGEEDRKRKSTRFEERKFLGEHSPSHDQTTRDESQ